MLKNNSVIANKYEVFVDGELCLNPRYWDKFGELTDVFDLAIEGEVKHPNGYFIVFDLYDKAKVH